MVVRAPTTRARRDGERAPAIGLANLSAI